MINPANAQIELPNLISPAPNAFEMTRFESQQPSLYTGTANINIPLYTIDFDGWSLPMSLSYHASGVLGNQEATEVGLGWSLSASAAITRTVIGQNDLTNTALLKGHKYATNLIPESITFQDSFWQSMFYGDVDTDPDKFSYSFFGYSGAFIFQRSSNNIIKLREDGCLIEFSDTDQTFTITTPTGFIGYFSVVERSTSASGSIAGNLESSWYEENNYIDVTSLQNKGMFRAITGWHLVRIESPNGKEIHFNYDLVPNGAEMESPYVSITQPTWGEGYYPVPVYRTIHEHVYLTNITIPGELSIDFTMGGRSDIEINDFYSGYFPVPFSNPKKYTFITINGLGTSTFQRIIDFDQSYFDDRYRHSAIAEASDPKWMRLRLDGLTIGDQEYQFRYYHGNVGLPHKSTRALDHFGTFNNRISDEEIMEEPWTINDGTAPPDQISYYQRQSRKPDFDFAVAGALRKVIYPTKGYTEYTYELHDYYVGGVAEGKGAESINSAGSAGNVFSGGLRIASIETKDHTGTTIRKNRYEYIDDTGFSSGRLMTPLYYYVYFLDQGSDPNDPQYFVRKAPASSFTSTHSAEGKRIGYGKVTEVTEGEGTSFASEYYFVNEPTSTEPDLDATQGEVPARDFSFKNGKPVSTISMDGLGFTVQTKGFELKEGSLGVESGVKTFKNQFGEFFWIKYAIPTENVEIDRIVTTTHTPDGDIVEDRDIDFNTNWEIISEKSQGSKFGTSTPETETRFKRPRDIANPGTAVTEMISRNMVEPVIETVKYVDGQVVAAYGTQWEYLTGYDIVVPKYQYQYNTGLTFQSTSTGSDFSTIGGYELINSFTQLNDNGKITELLTVDGITSSFIWGHNNTLVLAKGVGVSFNDLETAYNETVGLSSFEAAFRDHDNSAAALITTYDHNPLVGPVAITDPNGLKSSYLHDDNHRLMLVLDHDNNVINEYDYNFRQEPAISSVYSSINSWDFGTISSTSSMCPGDSGEKILSITNDGNIPVIITNITMPSGFSTNWTGGSIQPESTVDMVIAMSSSPGTYSGNMVIDALDATDLSIDLVGTVTANSSCSLNYPAMLDFGATTAVFNQETLTLVNNGSENMAVEVISLSNEDDYSLNQYGPFCLAPAESIDIIVFFTPTVSGPIETYMSVQLGGCPALNDIVHITGTKTN